MAEQVRKLNAKAVLSGFFAVVLAVGLAIPASRAFAIQADEKQEEENAAPGSGAPPASPDGTQAQRP